MTQRNTSNVYEKFSIRLPNGDRRMTLEAFQLAVEEMEADHSESTLNRIQKQRADWALENFGEPKAYHLLLGMTEELGELCHAHLKREQGIRINENHEAAIKDALGDILIYALGYAQSQNLSLEDCLVEAWHHVRMRDWKNNKATGVAPQEA